MKTAISIPDELFHRVDERLAELKMNRSQFYSTAASHYLAALKATDLTTDIDAAIARIGDAGRDEADEVAEYNRGRLADLTADDEW